MTGYPSKPKVNLTLTVTRTLSGHMYFQCTSMHTKLSITPMLSSSNTPHEPGCNVASGRVCEALIYPSCQICNPAPLLLAQHRRQGAPGAVYGPAQGPDPQSVFAAAARVSAGEHYSATEEVHHTHRGEQGGTRYMDMWGLLKRQATEMTHTRRAQEVACTVVTS